MKRSRHFKIIDKIIIGNFDSIWDKNFILSENIRVTINCSEFDRISNVLDMMIENGEVDVEEWHLPVSLQQNKLSLIEFYKKIPNLVNMINGFYENNKVIYIYCDTGNYISAMVAVLFIMFKFDSDFDTAVNLVRSKNPNALPVKASIKKIVKMYDKNNYVEPDVMAKKIDHMIDPVHCEKTKFNVSQSKKHYDELLNIPKEELVKYIENVENVCEDQETILRQRQSYEQSLIDRENRINEAFVNQKK